MAELILLQYEVDDMFDVTLRDGGGLAVLGIMWKFLDGVFDAIEQRDIRMMKFSDTDHHPSLAQVYLFRFLLPVRAKKASGYDLGHYRRQVKACRSPWYNKAKTIIDTLKRDGWISPR